MFVLKVYNRELNRTRKTRIEEFKVVKEFIIRLYNDFIKSHSRYEAGFEIGDSDNKELIHIRVDAGEEYILIDVYKVSKTEVNNEQFCKDLGINLDN